MLTDFLKVNNKFVTHSDLEHKTEAAETFSYWCSPDQTEGKMVGGWE